MEDQDLVQMAKFGIKTALRTIRSTANRCHNTKQTVSMRIESKQQRWFFDWVHYAVTVSRQTWTLTGSVCRVNSLDHAPAMDGENRAGNSGSLRHTPLAARPSGPVQRLVLPDECLRSHLILNVHHLLGCPCTGIQWRWLWSCCCGSVDQQHRSLWSRDPIVTRFVDTETRGTNTKGPNSSSHSHHDLLPQGNSAVELEQINTGRWTRSTCLAGPPREEGESSSFLEESYLPATRYCIHRGMGLLWIPGNSWWHERRGLKVPI